MAATPDTMYYQVRLLYKRTYGGELLETSGVDVPLGSKLFHKCFGKESSISVTREIGENGFRFRSTEFPLDTKTVPPNADFNCIRLCEAHYTHHVSGVLLLANATHRYALRALSREKTSIRVRIHHVGQHLSKLYHKKQLTVEEAQRVQEMREELRIKENMYAHLDSTQLAFLKPKPVNPPVLDFCDYFCLTVLSQQFYISRPIVSHLQGKADAGLFDDCVRYTNAIHKLFEDRLLCRSPLNDKWDSNEPGIGSKLFLSKLQFFTGRFTQVLFCLPAFPCKSSNPQKTASEFPDGAEYEALENLHQFCAAIRRQYPHGVVLFIVSDGHVFSDCIGVDDCKIFRYTSRLREMSEKIYNDSQFNLHVAGFKGSPIAFVNLHDIFEPTDLVRHLFAREYTDITINHPVSTQVDEVDEQCRKMMLAACGAPAGLLRDVIRNRPSHALTALYRGFSRFMLDDLAACKELAGKSKRHRKSFSEAVAFEMIQRNQAYSHLVELIMPKHIRLSIHAHNNAGPKFAVSLLPKRKFRTIRSFDDICLPGTPGAASIGQSKHLHIPTPWHNVLAEIEGHSYTYICKNGLVEEELARPDTPYWTGSHYEKSHRRGGRYVLRLKSDALGFDVDKIKLDPGRPQLLGRDTEWDAVSTMKDDTASTIPLPDREELKLREDEAAEIMPSDAEIDETLARLSPIQPLPTPNPSPRSRPAELPSCPDLQLSHPEVVDEGETPSSDAEVAELEANFDQIRPNAAQQMTPRSKEIRGRLAESIEAVWRAPIAALKTRACDDEHDHHHHQIADDNKNDWSGDKENRPPKGDFNISS